MFNLPQHSGRSVREHAALFDTVFVSLWKHFNASSGAILAGDADVIDGLFHVRRMFGGALPQAWPDVALVLQHVDGYEARYARAWQAAEQLIVLLARNGAFRSQRVAHGTSMFFLDAPGAAPELMRARALERQVVLPAAIPGTTTFALQVNPTLLRMPAASLAQVLIESAGS